MIASPTLTIHFSVPRLPALASRGWAGLALRAKLQPLARPALLGLALVAFLPSCSSAPAILSEAEATAAAPKSPGPEVESATPVAPAPDGSKGPVVAARPSARAGTTPGDFVFNIEPVTARPESESPADAGRGPGESTSAARPRPGEASRPEASESSTQSLSQWVRPSPEELAGALRDHYEEAWSAATGADGGGLLAGEPRAEALGAARSIVAIGFLAERPGDDETTLSRALFLGSEKSADAQSRILAAAYLAHRGKALRAREILEEVMADDDALPDATARPDAADPERERGPFRIDRPALAQKIEGPGRYTAVDPEQVRPGRTIFLYGEFVGFASRPKPGSPELHQRAFEASLRVISKATASSRETSEAGASKSGEEVLRLDFLPARSGQQESPRIDEVTNFWARIKLPARLLPGAYSIEVTAQDLIGGTTARSSLPLEVFPEEGSKASVR